MDDDSSYSKLQLCLTWNSFTDNIINSLESSYGDGDFVDVTLACEGESIKAHKLVLSACSQYLKRLLKVWYYCQYQFLCIYGQFIGIHMIKLHC